MSDFRGAVATEASARTKSRQRQEATALLPLTSLRFFAAAAIVFFHLATPFGYTSDAVRWSTAVTLFFVLSGFILTYVHSDLKNRGDIFRFYTARVARIWPLHILTLLVALHLPYTDRNILVFFLNFLLVQSWSPDLLVAMSFNGVAWSISNEIFFYLLFPLVIISRRHFTLWYIGAIALVAAVITAGNILGPGAMGDVAPSWRNFAHVAPPVRFLEFLTGVGFGLLFLRFRELRLSSVAWTGLEILALFAVYATSQFDRSVALAYSLLGQVGGDWFVFSGNFPIIGLVVVCFAYGGGLVSRILSLTPLVILGEISFSTYMLHQLIQRLWSGAGWTDGTWRPASYVLILVVIYGASYLSWRFLERPARRLILKLAAKHERADPLEDAAQRQAV